MSHVFRSGRVRAAVQGVRPGDNATISCASGPLFISFISQIFCATSILN